MSSVQVVRAMEAALKFTQTWKISINLEIQRKRMKYEK